MRGLETEIRRQKDTAVAAQAAGDNVLRQECQQNINALVRRYETVSKVPGVAKRRHRMTVEGFKRAKPAGLTNDEKRDILRKKLNGGDITATLNADKKNPHILGTLKYKPNAHSARREG